MGSNRSKMDEKSSNHQSTNNPQLPMYLQLPIEPQQVLVGP